MFTLYMEKGEQAGEEFALREGENLLGRSHEAHIRLQASDVSSQQARISVHGRKVVLDNLSQYGTWVNERKLAGTESAVLEVGQSIRVGKHAVLRLKEQAPPPSESPGSREECTAVAEKSISATRATSLRAVTVPPDVRPQVPEAPGGSEKTSYASSATSPPGSSGMATDFARVMQAKAEAANLDDSTGESSDGETQAQKTRPGSNEEIQRKLENERKRPRRRLIAVLIASIAGMVLLFLLLRPPPPEGKLSWDDTYADGIVPVPLGGYRLVFPSNETSKITSVDGVTIITRLGRQRDVPLWVTLREYVDDKCASQDSSKSVEDWISSNPDRICDRPNSSFQGQQNGVRIWSVPYMRNKPEKMAGQTYLFSHGRRWEILSVEIPAADQARAEDFLYYMAKYLDFPQDFEESHWEGRAPSANLAVPALFDQIRADLGREAPLTWAAIGKQLALILSQAVASKQEKQEEEAVGLLIRLHQQQARWYNSQHLQMINAQRMGDDKRAAAIARGCQAVFSDLSDRRYFEVRQW